MKASKPHISAESLFRRLSPAAQREYLDFDIAHDFSHFLMKVFETVSPSDVFQGNWHIDAMTCKVELLIKGKIKRLIVTVPPRHLKSIIFSVALTAFLLGLDPTLRIVCVSYSNVLAVKHANDFRAVVNSDWYRRIFSRTKISPEKDTEGVTMTTARGYRMAKSLTGSLAGFGGDIIILDDPQKPDEALSEATRRSTGQAFDANLLQRLNSKADGIVVLVMQRLHEDDLAGRLLEKGGWEHLKIPAIAEQEERVPIGRGRLHKRRAGTVIDPRRESIEDLTRLRQTMGELLFSGQYQQNPIPLEGNIIKAAWFKEYDVVPTPQPRDLFVISVDTAMKGDPHADYSVATAWMARGEHMYLLDLWRERVSYPELKRAVLRLRERYPTAALVIENKGSGMSLMEDLRAQNVASIGFNPDGDKETRLAAVSVLFESGAVLFPKGAAWLDALKAELLGFPNLKHDDQVDSVSQALLWIRKRRRNELPFVVPFVAGRPRYVPGS
jgi:predicted phage terminase large subunit-like protein